MSESDDGQNTRPISVAELLARHGTIGAPPAGGRRRKRRGNADAISVAELTGEIPIIRDEPPVENPAEPTAEPVVEVAVEVAEEVADEVADEVDEVAGDADEAVAEVEPEAEAEPEAGPQAEADDGTREAAEESAEDSAEAEDVPEDEDVVEAEQAEVVEEELADEEAAGREEAVDVVEAAEEVIATSASGAEQMAPDPVDDSVDLDELLADHEHETETLRSYLQDSSGALFSGGTIADDIARRGGGAEPEATSVGAEDARAKAYAEAHPQSRLGGFRAAMVAVFQSVLAVVFGAGLFLAFDQLWRWNTIVALVLSVLVILGLVIAVRVVRKTEDIASTLIAVAVGGLVTLGPLALLQAT